uniref:Uncharacterized protein n=1 Tax=Glossina brevipalpis TaxID=37001 RepID=A0A1A9WV96_9MUSC
MNSQFSLERKHQNYEHCIVYTLQYKGNTYIHITLCKIYNCMIADITDTTTTQSKELVGRHAIINNPFCKFYWFIKLFKKYINKSILCRVLTFASHVHILNL